MTTLIILTIFLLALVLSLLTYAFFLRLGSRWVKAPDATMPRIIIATVLIFAVQVLLTLAMLVASSWAPAEATFIAILDFVLTAILTCWIIAKLFNITAIRTVQVWLTALVPTLVLNLLLALAVRQFVAESFYIPTNSMAPTLLGIHCQSVCPKCGELSYCSLIEVQRPDHVPNLICRNFHVTAVEHVEPKITSGDHIIATKFVAPRRWDIIVFQYPAEPRAKYAMRLVGLPGETLHIEDGAVWIDGRKLDPPESLRGIQYLDEIQDFHIEGSGTKDNPAVLGPDEYFVLGDFSMQSSDSRFWQFGSPGHHPYAVPQSHLIGVVTHTYWPLKRWCIFR